MTTTDIHDALRAVADSATPPAPDRLDFQRRVRAERRRRTATRVGTGVAAATVAAVGVAVVAPWATSGPTAVPGPSVAGEAGGTVELSTPFFYVASRRLTVLTPGGDAIDLEQRTEDVLGATTDAVYVTGDESSVVRIPMRADASAPGGWGFGESETVVGPVQSARLSDDGRWLGWIDLDERLTVRDLSSGTDTGPASVGAGSAFLADLTDSGAALVSAGRSLTLRDGGEVTELPLWSDGYGVASTASDQRVAVVDRDGQTRVYAVDGGAPVEEATLPGSAYLSPTGEAAAGIDLNSDSMRSYVWVPGGDRAWLDVPDQTLTLGWADADTVVVVAGIDKPQAYACDVAAPDDCITLPIEDPADIRLAY